MGILDRKPKGLKAVENFDASKFLREVLQATSGSDVDIKMRYNIYYKLVAFKGVRDGIGTSTIVANTAIALAKLGLRVCVLDTSILNPTQCILLNTKDNASKDWLDMPYTNENVLATSNRDSKIQVLSFKNRGIVDMLSTKENEELAMVAINNLYPKYDILLVDLCSEPSAVATACLQKCQKLVQVWTNSPACLSSIPQFISNNVTCSCSLNKMKSIVTSCVVDDIKTDWSVLVDKYKFRLVANFPLSLDVARVVALNKPPFNYPSKELGIDLFNEGIRAVLEDLLELEVVPVNLTGITEDILRSIEEQEENDKLDLESPIPLKYTDSEVEDFDTLSNAGEFAYHVQDDIDDEEVF